MDHRIVINERYGKLICPLTGASFSFDPGSAESKAAARDKLVAKWTEATAAIEAHVGRRLSRDELYGGLPATETRSESELTAARQAAATAATLAVQPQYDDGKTENPHLNRDLQYRRRQMTPDEFRQANAEAWQAKRDAEAKQQRRDTDPKRLRARELAQRALTDSKYDASATVEEREFAESLVGAAEGDLRTFQALHRKYLDRRAEKLKARQTEFDKLAAELNDARAKLTADEFTLDDPPPEPQPQVTSLWDVRREVPTVQMTEAELQQQLLKR